MAADLNEIRTLEVYKGDEVLDIINSCENEVTKSNLYKFISVPTIKSIVFGLIVPNQANLLAYLKKMDNELILIMAKGRDMRELAKEYYSIHIIEEGEKNYILNAVKNYVEMDEKFL